MALRLYELALTAPVLGYIAYSIYTDPEQFNNPVIFVWMAAIATVDLLPVPTTVSSVAFSLSFPLELSVALLYPTPVAALIAFCGSSDPRELRREIPIDEGAVDPRADRGGRAVRERRSSSRSPPSSRNGGVSGSRSCSRPSSATW